MKAHILLLLGLGGVLAVQAETSAPVTFTRQWRDARTGLTILAGEVELPARAWWEITPDPRAGGALRAVFLLPPPVVVAAFTGQRLAELEERRTLKAARFEISSLYWACREYARQHGSIGPLTLDDLGQRLPSAFQDAEVRGRFFLVPYTPLPTNAWAIKFDSEAYRVLAFETQPEIDDGKHWVLGNNGQTRRVKIDPQLARRYGISIVPRRLPQEERVTRLGDTVRYRVLARLAEGASLPQPPVTWTVRDRFSDRTHRVRWTPARAVTGEASLLTEWARRRVEIWQRLQQAGPSLALSVWLQQAPVLYGLDPKDFRSRPRRRSERTTLFNALGGRAAIRETLQLQDLAPVKRARDAASSSVPIASLKGVTVKARDYERLLNGQEGGRLPLAEVVPHDRFFVWFPQPASLLSLLDTSAGFLSRLGGGITGQSLRYDLLPRYLNRLGMNESFLRSLLEANVLAEVALFTPDLCFIDGTDVTVVARLRDPDRLAPLLKLIGLDELTEITARPAGEGCEVFWWRQGDRLLISTHRDELERARALQAADGAESLGRSAEFRYLLTQLPPGPPTRAFCYFSDPFLRRLTGPAVKIGQYRRALARGQMEAASAGALLYRLDHDGAMVDFSRLVARGYVPRLRGAPTDIRLDAQGRAVSARYGSPGAMRTLLELDLPSATPEEAAAYETYRRNYEQFWRRYFDPIALRLDQTGADRMSMEVFILPLIENSFYRRAREFFVAAESDVPLRTPVIEPEPVALLSCNLTEESWLRWLADFERFIVRAWGIRTPLLDQLGPSIHVAVGDNDPIIHLGGGDLLGGFNGASGGNIGELAGISLLASLFTQPTTLWIEVQDPERTRQLLERLPAGKLPRGGAFGEESALYRVAGREEWRFTLSIEGVVKLRYGLSLQGRYLVISNRPLSWRPRLVGERIRAQNGAGLTLAPRAARRFLPALFAAAQERNRQAAMRGLSLLYPVVVSGLADVDEAAAAHRRVFGFAPVHPVGGRFEWTRGQLRSSVFGRPGAEQQPPFDAAASRDFGLLRQVRLLELSMQLEQDGLRARCAWQYQPASSAP